MAIFKDAHETPRNFKDMSIAEMKQRIESGDDQGMATFYAATTPREKTVAAYGLLLACLALLDQPEGAPTHQDLHLYKKVAEVFARNGDPSSNQVMVNRLREGADKLRNDSLNAHADLLQHFVAVFRGSETCEAELAGARASVG
jgi:hypothetical protein